MLWNNQRLFLLVSLVVIFLAAGKSWADSERLDIGTLRSVDGISLVNLKDRTLEMSQSFGRGELYNNMDFGRLQMHGMAVRNQVDGEIEEVSLSNASLNVALKKGFFPGQHTFIKPNSKDGEKGFCVGFFHMQLNQNLQIAENTVINVEHGFSRGNVYSSSGFDFFEQDDIAYKTLFLKSFAEKVIPNLYSSLKGINLKSFRVLQTKQPSPYAFIGCASEKQSISIEEFNAIMANEFRLSVLGMDNYPENIVEVGVDGTTGKYQGRKVVHVPTAKMLKNKIEVEKSNPYIADIFWTYGCAEDIVVKGSSHVLAEEKENGYDCVVAENLAYEPQTYKKSRTIYKVDADTGKRNYKDTGMIFNGDYCEGGIILNCTYVGVQKILIPTNKNINDLNNGNGEGEKSPSSPGIENNGASAI